MSNEKRPTFQLGTVQLGMDYGLGDHTKKPPREYAFFLLDRAIAQGVDTLDTASNYGESEAVIGAWLQTVPAKKQPRVITKIGPFDHSSEQNLRADIRRQTEGTLSALRLDSADTLMVHMFEDYDKDPDVVRDEFCKMKREGLAREIGISAYSRHDYRKLAASGFDSVQIPLNVFDWGQIESGGMRALADAGISVYARSVFLQGLVFLTPKTLDPRMDFCLPYLTKFLGFCEEFDMSPAVLALSFVFSVPAVSTVVLGCQTVEQLDENCAVMARVRALSPAQMEKLHAAFHGIDPRVIDPGKWFNHF